MAVRYNLPPLDQWWDEGEEDDPKRKVPERLLRHLVVDMNLSGSEVERVLWSEYGISYSRAGVSWWRSRQGLPPRKTPSENRRALIPWRIKVEHQGHRLYRFLLTEAQLRDGLVPTTADAYRHAAVVREFARRPGLVIFYDQEDGFRLVPRRDRDEDFIWDPRLP